MLSEEYSNNIQKIYEKARQETLSGWERFSQEKPNQDAINNDKQIRHEMSCPDLLLPVLQ